MEIILNRELDKILGLQIGVLVENGDIIYVKDKEAIADITDYIYEFVVASLLDKKTINVKAFNRIFKIEVTQMTDLLDGNI